MTHPTVHTSHPVLIVEKVVKFAETNEDATCVQTQPTRLTQSSPIEVTSKVAVLDDLSQQDRVDKRVQQVHTGRHKSYHALSAPNLPAVVATAGITAGITATPTRLNITKSAKKMVVLIRQTGKYEDKIKRNGRLTWTKCWSVQRRGGKNYLPAK